MSSKQSNVAYWTECQRHLVYRHLVCNQQRLLVTVYWAMQSTLRVVWHVGERLVLCWPSPWHFKNGAYHLVFQALRTRCLSSGCKLWCNGTTQWRDMAVLHLKHPPCPPASSDTSFTPHLHNISALQTLNLQCSEVIYAIKSYLGGFAGGYDGLRPLHLKHLTSPHTGEAGQKLVVCLIEFSNFCLAGKVP